MRAPALAWLAVTAGLLDLVVTRVALRAVEFAPSAQRALNQGGRVFLNLAVLAGMIAFILVLIGFVKHASYIPFFRRVALALFAGIFSPTILLTLALPAQYTNLYVIIFSIGSAHILATILGMAALHWRAPPGIRFGVALFSVAAFCSFGSLVFAIIGPTLDWTSSYILGRALRHLGELCFLLAPFCVAHTTLPRRGGPFKKALVAFLASLLIVGGGIAWIVLRLPADDAKNVLYATRLLLFDSAPIVYAGVLGLGFAFSFASLFSVNPADRQAALGVLALLAASYKPSSTGLLVGMVIGSCMLARAAMAHATMLAIRKGIRPAVDDEDAATDNAATDNAATDNAATDNAATDNAATDAL